MLFMHMGHVLNGRYRLVVPTLPYCPTNLNELFFLSYSLPCWYDAWRSAHSQSVSLSSALGSWIFGFSLRWSEYLMKRKEVNAQNQRLTLMSPLLYPYPRIHLYTNISHQCPNFHPIVKWTKDLIERARKFVFSKNEGQESTVAVRFSVKRSCRH